MNSTQLNILIQVADCGSFSKAAEKLYISSTAIMKQMNLLETYIGIPLLIRTNHGVQLTDAGKSLYKDARFLMQYSEEAVQRARQTMQANQYVIRVGTSMLNPSKILMDLWNQVNDINPQFKLKIVPFNDDFATPPITSHTIGKDFDFIIGLYDTVTWKDYSNVYELGRYHFFFAVSRNHRLASKKELSLSDLYGERLMMIKRGNSPVIDGIRDYIVNEHPAIKIEDTPYSYDIDVFNRCEQSGAVLLTLDSWKDIHPALVTIPTECDCTLPYGIMYPLNPSEGAKLFLDALKKVKTA
ncbi:DNA-binding transcriptional regulator, LysR family [Anaerocolumna jejuensis DSM 15929]|uniref:DNA-binding transcriptional regulator, LysR family n=1 Tax=Anaerocolumna jejuensis DSM 15929 TaxID=1121322 RepID=A0A1M7BTU1_9FIRM|nr:LysR family transcriptional regulator [Anaerocolumna jejuensis]SHL58343.1 DNA-binding transcriptional regulator, LysR family [Anaerocolumna jejuensis DSM 15929]